MPKLNFIIISDSAEISSEENKLSIFGAFDSISASDFPAVHPSLTIVVNMEIKVGHYTESFKIKNEKDQIILEDSMEFDAKQQRHQFIHHINNLELQATGQYTVEIYVDNELLGSTYFLAKKSD